MTCFYCKGNIESSTTTYMTDYQGCYIIIKNVPCEKCSQCGEEYLNGETLERIEEIIQKVKGMLTEIAVVDYKQTALIAKGVIPIELRTITDCCRSRRVTC